MAAARDSPGRGPGPGGNRVGAHVVTEVLVLVGWLGWAFAGHAGTLTDDFNITVY